MFTKKHYEFFARWIVDEINKKAFLFSSDDSAFKLIEPMSDAFQANNSKFKPELFRKRIKEILLENPQNGHFLSRSIRTYLKGV